MANETLYLVTLNFKPETVGAGEMLLQLAVDAVNGHLHGLGHGKILEGTEHPQSFGGSGSGAYHATGFGNITKVGALNGQSIVSVAPPAIGTYLAPFSVNFGVDNNWKGTGTFSVGQYTYKCQVTKAG